MDDEERTEPRRVQILEFITAHPGTHLREIKRELNLAMGVVQYHLNALEKERKIIPRRRGLYKRFYSTVPFGDEQLEILNVLSQETERDILLYLLQKPDATQKEVSEYAEISPASVNWHMRRLAEARLVEARREGSRVRYVVKGSHAEILTLVKSYHPMIWERWADRLADVMLDISETEGRGKREREGVHAK
jgi:predicted transcriptional regulator